MKETACVFLNLFKGVKQINFLLVKSTVRFPVSFFKILKIRDCLFVRLENVKKGKEAGKEKKGKKPS